MSKKTDIIKFIQKRQQCHDSLLRIQRFLSEHKDEDLSETLSQQLSVRNELIIETFQKYQDIQSDIACIDKTKVEISDDFEKLYLDLKANINAIISKSISDSSVSKNEKCLNPTSNISLTKLPNIEIPIFDGKNLNQFKPFIDIFTAVIDNNSNLSSVEKLFYLRSYLKGEALSLISNLPLVNESYNEALKLLKNRFDNEFILINNHIYSLLDIPNIVKGTTQALREFVSKIRQQLGSLKNLKMPVEQWDMILICILTRKLDSYTNRAYQIYRDLSTLPTLDDFLIFLENRASALAAVAQPDTKKEKIVSNLATKEKLDFKCKFCHQIGHKVYNCEKFKSLPTTEKISFIDKNKICKLCLNVHQSKCKFVFKCQLCHKDHNTLLHLGKQDTNTVSALSKINCLTNRGMGNVLLPTVQLQIKTRDGNLIIARGLLDSGSQSSFITSELVKNLKLTTFKSNLSVGGISSNNTKLKRAVVINISSCVYDYKINVTCAVVENITTNLPQISFNTNEIKFPNNIQFADKNYNESRKIDILLGADIFFESILSGTINLGKNNLILQNTLFGYVVSGSIPKIQNNNLCNLSVVSLHSTKNLDTLVNRFWENEKVPELYKEFTDEHKACESKFIESVQVINNRYEVKLPLKQDLQDIQLGDSFAIAFKRFLNLEKRFNHNPELFEQYTNFINEYIKLGHARVIDINEYNKEEGPVYFLAHHAVLREDKATTKLRVVFDGSMRSKNGNSINDFMFKGPVVQNELFDILILFRTYKFVLLTDIKQMYRMISIHPSHRRLQNILWRENSEDQIQCLQLQTVTYGLRSSSFLATRCILHLAQTYKDKFPLASDALINNTYVDDILGGANSIHDTINLKNELIELLRLGSCELHKWCSNDPAILQNLPDEIKQFSEIDLDKSDLIVKTLGVSYNTQTDSFKIFAPHTNIENIVTKRQVLSFVCKFYDPLGLVGPIFVAAKLIIQKMWEDKLQWDDPLPENILKPWQTFATNLINMPTITVPRNLALVGATKVELVGYCDASMNAYGSVIYLRVFSGNKINVSLLCSKSRIASLNKKLTIPRLELNSALLLSMLANKIFNLLKSYINDVYLYSDSTIALAWINTEALKLNPYVANRVTKIQNISSNFKWLYINTKDNPADCLSRGVEPSDMVSNNTWFYGPANLLNSNFDHKMEAQVTLKFPLPEQKVQTFANTIKFGTFFKDYSNLSKLQRIIAYILRFKNNCLKTQNISGNLKPVELSNALKIIIKVEQQNHFNDEIKNLSFHKSKLKSLSPFLDHDGILRVGGRLQNANVSFDQKHPIILPKSCHVTNLIILKEHEKLFHAGQKQILSSLNLKYWLINGIREIKKNIHKCVICFKLKAQCAKQLMGSLPQGRVTISRPFQNVGVDFCGPFYIKQARIRKPLITKCYVALFVCFAVKAIHMEVLSDLTTECFLAALKRFIGRRGKPTIIHCDNGSTFKGANNQLKEFYKIYNSYIDKNKIENVSTEEGIRFKFIPSYSPVFGGLWEAGVKSAKYHLKRVIGNNQLSYEEFNTLIIQIEGILNSRPLTQLSNDPSDLTYLTPGHFLIGAPLTTFPEPNLTDIPQNRLKFWKLCTQMQQSFWDKWHKDYLAQLQSRPKWQQESPNVKKGMLVLLKQDHVPSQKWPLARIEKVIPGADGKIRVVHVKTQNGTYIRSITKIAKLPIYEN